MSALIQATAIARRMWPCANAATLPDGRAVDTFPTGVSEGNTYAWNVETLLMSASLVGISMPSFWLGLLLILLFGLVLHWLPIAGGSGWRALVLPAVTLAAQAAAVLARLTRASLLEVLPSDYVRTARAKGVASRRVLFHHALRNALIPVVTVIGLQFGGLLGGAVIVESVFARSGLGRFAVGAIQARDFPLIQGIVVFAAAVYALVNLSVDVLYLALDPRISYD